GRVHSGLLVPNQDMLEIVLFVDCVVDVQHRAAGIAKNVVYARFGQAAHDDIGAIEFHDVDIPFVISTNAPIGPWAQAGTGPNNMIWRFMVHGTMPPRHLADPMQTYRNTAQAF